MKRLLASSTLAVTALATALFAWPAAPTQAARSQEQLRQIAAKLAAELALACPHTAIGNPTAFETCATTLTQTTAFPLAAAVLWGGDQATLPIKSRKLTRFSADVFRSNYMPLLTFTGRYSVDRDERDKLDIIRVEAYFRNALAPGEYPYPFWHSSDKWNAYETMNRVNFYLNDAGKITVITRASDGSDANRGTYARIQPPAFVKDQWMWTDASGHQQPQVMLFSARYLPSNPQLPALNDTYRVFANTMREASCVSCHNPSNPPGARQLILLQTPLHAAGEIDRVIKSVQGGAMPLDDVGLPADLEPKQREAILTAARAFRDQLTAADKWEVSQRQATSSSDLIPTTGGQPRR